MKTAAEIAKELKLDVYVVRYRLSVLRKDKIVKGKKYGLVYVYPKTTIKHVRDFAG